MSSDILKFFKDLEQTVKPVQSKSASYGQGERWFKPVPPSKFFSSLYYSGFQKDEIYDFWIDVATEFIDSQKNELIITGSLGTGKTMAANLIWTYKTYDLFSYKDRNAYLGLPSLQDVYNIYFNISRTQAARTGYSQLRAIIDESEWFFKYAPRDKSIDSALAFFNRKFTMLSGSALSHQIGMTIWSFILDEADFYAKNGVGFDENYDKVTGLYQQLLDRRTSRFKKYGKDVSFSILVSSASYQSSFVDKRIEEAIDDPTCMIIKAVAYKMKPKGTYSDETFCVFVGHEMIDPEIVKDSQILNRLIKGLKDKGVDKKLTLEQNLALINPKFRELFELVPVDLRSAYDRNLPLALMNHSGLYTARVGKLFQSLTLLTQSYNPTLKHPFSKMKLEASTGNDIQLKEYLYLQYTDYRERPHAIHIDQSVSGDNTGVSMARYDGIVNIDGVNRKKYTQVFSVEIVPPPSPFQIKISKVRDFILFLKQEAKFNIIIVTTDQYQSTQMRQDLEAEIGETTKIAHLSIDKNDDPYLVWMGLLLDGDMTHYKNEVIEKQAGEEIHYRDKKKCDHPKGGAHDVLQSLVGSIYNLVTFQEIDQEFSEGDYNLPKREKEFNIKKEFGLNKYKYTDNYAQSVNKVRSKKSFYDNLLED